MLIIIFQCYAAIWKVIYDYRCSNGQLRRVIGLTQYEVDTLFPLEHSSDIDSKPPAHFLR